MSNQEMLMEWRIQNNNLNISIQNDFLVVENKLIPLNGLKLVEIYDGNFKENFSSMTSEQVGEIIKLNAVRKKAKADSMNAESQIDAIKEVSQETSNSIKNIGLREINGKQYVYYTDEQGNYHVLYKYAPTDILRVYNEMLAETRSLNGITEKALFERLERKMQNIELQDSKQVVADGRNNVSERTMDYYRILDSNVKDKSKRVQGSTEHEVFMADGNLEGFNYGDNGELIRLSGAGNGFETSENSNESIESIEQQPVEQDVISNLISEERFRELISSPVAHSSVEQEQVALFSAYIGELFIYKEMLNSELTEILNRYLYTINKILQAKEVSEINENQNNAINKYEQLKSKAPEAAKGLQKEDVMKLILKKPDQYDKAGFIKNMFISFITIVSVAFLGIIAAVLLINK